MGVPAAEAELQGAGRTLPERGGGKQSWQVGRRLRVHRQEPGGCPVVIPMTPTNSGRPSCGRSTSATTPTPGERSAAARWDVLGRVGDSVEWRDGLARWEVVEAAFGLRPPQAAAEHRPLPAPRPRVPSQALDHQLSRASCPVQLPRITGPKFELRFKLPSYGPAVEQGLLYDLTDVETVPDHQAAEVGRKLGSIATAASRAPTGVVPNRKTHLTARISKGDAEIHFERIFHPSSPVTINKS